MKGLLKVYDGMMYGYVSSLLYHQHFQDGLYTAEKHLLYTVLETLIYEKRRNLGMLSANALPFTMPQINDCERKITEKKKSQNIIETVKPSIPTEKTDATTQTSNIKTNERNIESNTINKTTQIEEKWTKVERKKHNVGNVNTSKHKKEQVRTKHTYKVLQEEEDISMESHDDGTVPSLKDPEEDTSRAGNRSYEVDNVSMKDLEEEIDRYKKDDKSGSVEYDASTKKRNDEIIGLKGKLMDAERMYAEAEKKYHELDAWYAERVNHLNAEVASLKEKALEEENKRKDLTDRYKARIERKEEEWLKKEIEYEENLKVLEEMVKEELGEKERSTYDDIEEYDDDDSYESDGYFDEMEELERNIKEAGLKLKSM